MKAYFRQWRLLLVASVAFAVLIGLGSWQVYRLQWKQNLIALLEHAVTAKPVSIEDAEAGEEHGYNIDWLRAHATGYYRHDLERHVYGIRKGKAGWRVLTPLVKWGEYVLLVDRGFVPDEKKDPASRPDSLTPPDFRKNPRDVASGEVPEPISLTGMIRIHAAKKPLFAPENQPGKNKWYWHDLTAIYHSLPDTLGHAAEDRPARYIPFVLQLQPGGEPGHRGVPAIDPVDLKLPNNHLGYAITWFGLAIVLVFVTIAFARSRVEKIDP